MYEHNTRRKCDFHVPGCSASLFKKSAINMGKRLYKMPARIKKLGSFMDFKQKLKLLLLVHPFYSLNEFYCI